MKSLLGYKSELINITILQNIYDGLGLHSVRSTFFYFTGRLPSPNSV
jgi:hypothetical protein